MSRLERPGRPIDVAGPAPRQRRDDRSRDVPRDPSDRLRVVLGGDGEAGFEDVDAERVDRVRQAELLVRAHGEAWRLFAVPEGRVEDHKPIGHAASVRARRCRSQSYDLYYFSE